jgi:tRNA (cmo5U34)-methyltransferase
MSEFDIKANNWDKNNVHLERSRTIANQMKQLIPFKPGMKAMEFGAGTALLSFVLQDLFDSVLLIDSSQEMIRICNEKIAAINSDHIKALQIDLETEDLEDKFDFIYSQMAFHHIIDIAKMIHKFYHLLDEIGILAIADLFPEDGSFHGEGFTGHRGFEPELLEGIMWKVGFRSVHHITSYVQKKIEPDGKLKEYPVFLIIAKKYSQ